MGPLANATQLRDMHAEPVHGDGGRGSLVSSLYTDDLESAGATVEGDAPFDGRLHHGGSKTAGHLGARTVLPMLTRGESGRADGDEKPGGEGVLGFYMKRAAVGGFQPVIDDLMWPILLGN